MTEEANERALDHVTHSKFDVLNKITIYGFKNETEKPVFDKVRDEYVQYIIDRLPKSLKSSHFSHNEKRQMRIVACSYGLFMLTKRCLMRMCRTNSPRCIKC